MHTEKSRAFHVARASGNYIAAFYPVNIDETPYYAHVLYILYKTVKPKHAAGFVTLENALHESAQNVIAAVIVLQQLHFIVRRQLFYVGVEKRELVVVKILQAPDYIHDLVYKYRLGMSAGRFNAHVFCHNSKLRKVMNVKIAAPHTLKGLLVRTLELASAVFA